MSQALPSSRQPLTGLTVIDLSHFYNGPYATFLMAMAGAKVIKVEPFQGEHLRSRGDTGGASMSFAMLNSNKKPVTLNLKTEKGRELLARDGRSARTSWSRTSSRASWTASASAPLRYRKSTLG